MAKVKDSRVKILAKVNNAVFEVTVTARILAHASSPVLFDAPCAPDTMITHILSATFLTHLQVGITVEFCKVTGRNATLTMKTIDIL